MSTLFLEYKPSPPLAAFVQSYWTGDFNRHNEAGFSQSVVPNGSIELIIHLTNDHCALSKHDSWVHSPDFTLIGLYTASYEVRFSKRVQVFGVRFNPEGIHNIFGIRPGLFTDSYEDSKTVFGHQFDNYCSKLRETPALMEKIAVTEKFLLAQLSCNYRDFDYTRLAAGIIRKHQGLLQLEELTKQVPISPRQLQREFKNRYGITAKAYMRLARMNAIQNYMQDAGKLSFSELSHAHGFADQSHFIREFKFFTGNNPGAFTRNRNKFISNPYNKNDTPMTI